jgi:hypothetical protein
MGYILELDKTTWINGFVEFYVHFSVQMELTKLKVDWRKNRPVDI